MYRTRKSILLDCLLACLLFAVGQSSVLALDLSQILKMAQEHDPQWAYAKASLEQALERKSQIAALWEPQALAQVSAGAGGSVTSIRNAHAMGMSDVNFETSVLAGGVASASVGIQKTLINKSLNAQEEVIDLSMRMAEVQQHISQVELNWRVVKTYFSVITAEQILEIQKRQLQIMQSAKKEIERRQAVGDATLIDVQEVKARVANEQAQIEQLQLDVDQAQFSLQQLTGIAIKNLNAVDEKATLFAKQFEPLNTWQEIAFEKSPILQLADLKVLLQEKEAYRIHVTGTTPSSQLVLRAQGDYLNGFGAYGSSGQVGTQYIMGVQWTYPLGAHGLIDAREQEALKQAQTYQREKDIAKSNIDLQIRQAWQSVNTAAARLKTLELALQASQQRLTSTRQAHLVGTRTTMEWLGAEQDAIHAELAWRMMRIQVVQARAGLWYASSQLEEPQIQEINQMLKP